MRVAIFVEGQTEAAFIRQLLAVVLGYEAVNCEITALAKSRGTKTPHPLPNPNASYHYGIRISSNDEKVLSDILERYQGHLDQKYERIIGLRDVLSSAYDKQSEEVKSDLRRFQEGAQRQIAATAAPDKIFFCFAIMEIEAWFLAMPDLFLHVDARLTGDYIRQKLKVDLAKVNIEEIYHPAGLVEDILKLVGKSYDKHENDIERIVSGLTKEMVEGLLSTNAVPSFTSFYKTIMPSSYGGSLIVRS